MLNFKNKLEALRHEWDEESIDASYEFEQKNYNFGDQRIAADSKIIANGVDYVEEAIRKDLHEVSNEIIVKILGVIRFVAKRRTKYGREYMNIIHQYVGQRIDTGIRILRC